MQTPSKHILNAWSSVATSYIKGSSVHVFDIAADPPSKDTPYGAVVAAGGSGIDLSWMRQTPFQAK